MDYLDLQKPFWLVRKNGEVVETFDAEDAAQRAASSLGVTYRVVDRSDARLRSQAAEHSENCRCNPCVAARDDRRAYLANICGVDQ